MEHPGRLPGADRTPQTEEEAIDYLNELAAHVAVWDRGARDALNTFLTAGQGDVLIAYENEAIFAQQAGPAARVHRAGANTLLIENAIAPPSWAMRRRPAKAFVDFPYTPEAQTVYGNHGFRPVVPEVLAAVPGLQDAYQPRHRER